YTIDQCALYRLGSKARLSAVLGITLDWLLQLAESEKNYCLFNLPEEVCPFTRRVKKARAVQAPKNGLRTVHERILHLLRPIILPTYAHAGIKGKSYRSNAAAHKDSPRLAAFDIRKFYPSTTASRVYYFFADKMLCSPDVARLLTALTCYKNGLPTGSPLSPLLSLHANMPMFDSLEALALSNDLVFTCYVDDLTFSGEKLPIGLPRLVKGIVEKYGHKVSEEKTRLYRRRQGKHVTGTVLLDGRILVPNTRFHKARAISAALASERDPALRLELGRKLSGLLGEAAFIDDRYAKWASDSYISLRKLQADFACEEASLD
ncbi:reverse transcriptase family protein, partial [Gulbenkiania mobilis]|uniref:reverse transcriptase family protein n=1 Tax=Gulbenkiania mobilis TaxID=397457 RepID=UPI0009FA98AB